MTQWIERQANAFLADGLQGGSKSPIRPCPPGFNYSSHQFLEAYVNDLPEVIDMQAIQDSQVHLGENPLGGASVAYYDAIAKRYHLNWKYGDSNFNPTFRFVDRRMERANPPSIPSSGLSRHRQLGVNLKDALQSPLPSNTMPITTDQ